MAIVTVNSKNGVRTIESDLTLRQAYDVLVAKANRSPFESDLCRHFEKWGNSLTSGRQQWLVMIAQEHLDRASRPQAPAVDLGGDFSAIRALFDMVRGKLQRPKFRLQTRDGRPVWLMVAGDTSRNAGSVSVTNGEPYGTPGSFYGRINQDGTTTVRDAGVVELLKEFAADPAGTAAAYGRLTGNCCFCKQNLTDERSTEAGYGPVCAGHYGLPWGDRPARGDVARKNAHQAVERAQEEAGFASDPDFRRHLAGKAAPGPAVSLSPWDASEAEPVAESPAEAKEAALRPFDLGELFIGCVLEQESYDRLPLLVVG